ncbi:MAG: hypothetical protein KGH98_00795 [Candidatus Micrarchaeota archaeon]|nr:hypothetical protein [Candidatus Micrarchaeota archaeon]
MAKKSANWGTFLLTFIGSLFYLYAVYWAYSHWGSLWWSTGPVSGTAGAAVAPLLFGLATIAAIGLFIMSFAGINMGGEKMNMMKRKATMGGAVTLLALGIGGGSTAFGIVVIGFILSIIGANME